MIVNGCVWKPLYVCHIFENYIKLIEVIDVTIFLVKADGIIHPEYLTKMK